MSSEKFCLRWNDFEANISGAFKELRGDKDFFDVTLACDDEQIQAHKVILAACSPFFRNVLRRNPHQHPLLYMKGVTHTDLKAVLNFMYHGEVNVAQEELNSFLSVAEDLRIKGLTQKEQTSKKSSSTSGVNNRPFSPKSAPSPIHRAPPQIRTETPVNSFTPSHDDDIQEIVPIKSEPVGVTASNATTVPQDQSLVSYQEDLPYQDYQDYSTSDYQDYADNVNSSMVQDSSFNKGKESDRSILHQYIKKENGSGRTLFVCSLCGKSNAQKSNLMNHVESVHFPNLFTYSCKYCGKVYNAKNSLNVHMSTSHREEKIY